MASRPDLGGLGGGIVVCRRDLGRLRGIVACRRHSSGLEGGMVVFQPDSGGLRGGIEGFGCVHALACFLGGTLGSNCYKAFLFDFDLL